LASKWDEVCQKYLWFFKPRDFHGKRPNFSETDRANSTTDLDLSTFEARSGGGSRGSPDDEEGRKGGEPEQRGVEGEEGSELLQKGILILQSWRPHNQETQPALCTEGQLHHVP
jgi:hypothetical protein